MRRQNAKYFSSYQPISETQMRQTAHHDLMQLSASSPEGKSEISYLLGLDRQRLHFSAHVLAKPCCNLSLREKDFVEGLWQGDVVELFCGEDDGFGYWELNLAAPGVWWMGRFSDYRLPCSEVLVPPEVDISFTATESSWWIYFATSHEGLGLNSKGLAGRRLNVCGIVGERPRRYYSFRAIDTAQPDFHWAMRKRTSPNRG